MAIDLRANATCTLGPLISASISDDYIQENGLIKVKGSCVIAEIIKPNPGDTVTFSYTKGGNTYQIPRILRVLSSFADPFRNTTSIELGCKLTYLEDVKSPIDWDALAEEGNEAYVEEDKEIIIIPIKAKEVAKRCLQELGVTLADPEQLKLTNRFSVEEFDFSGGFVSVLSDLLVSESLCGYLNFNEELVIMDLSKDTDLTAKVIPEDSVVDVGPIGVGDLPGDAVIVSYSYNKYKFPEVVEEATEEPPPGVPITIVETAPTTAPREVVDWTYSSSSTPEEFYYITYDDADGNTNYREFSGSGFSETFTNYATKQFISQEDGEVELRDVPIEKFTKNYGPGIADASAIATDYLKKGLLFNNAYIQRSGSNTYYTYTKYGDVEKEVVETFQTLAGVVAGLGIPFAFDDKTGVNVDYGLSLTEVQIVEYEYYGNSQKRVTTQYKDYALTQRGQQGLAMTVDSVDITNAAMASDIAATYISGAQKGGTGVLYAIADPPLTYLGQTVDFDIKAAIAPKPSAEDIIKNNGDQLAATAEDPLQAEEQATTEGEGITQASSSEIILATGSALAERRIEFSMPYAEDEWFKKGYTQYAGTKFVNYKVVESTAPQKAKTYGVVQNRLLLGNRTGMNIQTAPELMPESPFDPIAVQVKSISGMYRLNGTSWQIDSTGVVVSTDALFWGGIGAEPVAPGETAGEIWFPTAPGVTELPETPPVIDGEITVESVVPPWNEINITDFNTRTILIAGRLSYSLAPILTIADLTTKIPFQAERVAYLAVPNAVSVTQAFGAIKVAGSIDVRAFGYNSFDTLIAALAPRVVPSVDVKQTLIDNVITAYAPIVGTGIGTFANVTSVVNINIASVAPLVGREIGKFVKPSATDIAVAVGPSTRPTSTTIRPVAINVAIDDPVPQVGRQIGKFILPASMVITVEPKTPSAP